MAEDVGNGMHKMGSFVRALRAILFAPQEATEHRNLANHLTQGWRFGRWFFLQKG